MLGLLETENEWTVKRTTHLEPPQEEIVHEIVSRTRGNDTSVPVGRDRWWYVTRTREGKQYFATYRLPIDPEDPARRPAFNGWKHLIWDDNSLAGGGSLSACRVSLRPPTGVWTSWASVSSETSTFDCVSSTSGRTRWPTTLLTASGTTWHGQPTQRRSSTRTPTTRGANGRSDSIKSASRRGRISYSSRKTMDVSTSTTGLSATGDGSSPTHRRLRPSRPFSTTSPTPTLRRPLCTHGVRGSTTP